VHGKSETRLSKKLIASGAPAGFTLASKGRWRQSSPTNVQHDAMNVIFEVVLPVFGIIITGYLAGRFRVLGGDAASAINRLVFYFALPALLFTYTAKAPVAESLNWPFIGAFLGGTVVTFACRRLRQYRLFGHSPVPACFRRTGRDAGGYQRPISAGRHFRRYRRRGRPIDN
jgi:hypothetical protein